MKHQILFVDDEAPTRELVSLFFRKKGYLVTTATTAEEGRTLLDVNTYQLALLDVNLAGENGLDLLAYAKSKNRDLPVIIFTGLDFDEALVAAARARGADGCLSKTQSLFDLLAEVERLLPPSATQ